MFTSAVFEADINHTIIAIGVTVIFVSVLSGAWGVVASDFLQTLVVAVVSVACALVMSSIGFMLRRSARPDAATA